MHETQWLDILQYYEKNNMLILKSALSSTAKVASWQSLFCFGIAAETPKFYATYVFKVGSLSAFWSTGTYA